MVLCLIFGVTSSVCKLFLRIGRHLLVEMLSQDSSAKVRMPCHAEVLAYCDAIKTKYAHLNNVYSMIDGLKLRLEQSGNDTMQSMFYNGWQHDHYVSCIYVFAPDGTIIAAALNAPGSVHDSQIADWGGVYTKLEHHFETMGV